MNPYPTRDELVALLKPGQCQEMKHGEYNPLLCARKDGHSGDCCWYPVTKAHLDLVRPK